jgi:hypothetical protein
LLELLRPVLALLTRRPPRLAAPPQAPEPKWTEAFLYEYALARYKEADELIARGRQSAQSLLTWQTALFVAAVGIAAKGGLLDFRSHEGWIGLLTAAFILTFGAGVLLSARAAFWTEPAKTPVSPTHLLKDVCGPGIDQRALCQNLITVYDSTKSFVSRIQRRIRMSLILTAAGLSLFLVLLVLLSASHIEIIDQMFSSADRK